MPINSRIDEKLWCSCSTEGSSATESKNESAGRTWETLLDLRLDSQTHRVRAPGVHLDEV